jgi:hypothetical protein
MHIYIHIIYKFINKYIDLYWGAAVILNGIGVCGQKILQTTDAGYWHRWSAEKTSVHSDDADFSNKTNFVRFQVLTAASIKFRIVSLMMEAATTSETSVDNYFTRQCIPEDNSKKHTFPNRFNLQAASQKIFNSLAIV